MDWIKTEKTEEKWSIPWHENPKLEQSLITHSLPPEEEDEEEEELHT